MALFTPSESPAVVIKEIDLTGGVPNVQSTTGAIVGNFRWGPADVPLLVSSETKLAETFGNPSTSTNVDYFSAAQFLRYSSSLYVVREVTNAAYNAHAGYTSGSNDNIQIKNADAYADVTFGATNHPGLFIAKYPGALGNSLKVEFITANISSFSGWAYASYFDAAPGTSAWASAVSGANDEIHIVVIDEDGDISGVAGTVLETFAFVSLASDAKTPDGASNYIKDVLRDRSVYVNFGVWNVDADSDDAYDSDGSGNLTLVVANAGSTAAGTTFAASATSAISRSLANGADSGALTTAEFATGFDHFNDGTIYQVDFLIAPGMSGASESDARTAHTTVVNDMVSIAVARKDCIVIASPSRYDIISGTTPVTSAVTTAQAMTYSSYLVIDNNYLKVYDKYNDVYIWIPAASSTAGIIAATDRDQAPWFSPAGARRGQYLGITSIKSSPSKTERDTLYKAGINPIANIPGQGILLFGDKTHMSRPSAFDRINVRRLFIVLERAIAIAARNVMFEFNDEFTRAEFANVVEPVLREVKGRRGITDFKVVCDETNNTAAVIDRNEFIANIFIKPARSINYVTLNFVAVRTGVEFEEVVGTV